MARNHITWLIFSIILGDNHLVSMIEQYRCKNEDRSRAFAGICNRIDRPVSGLVCFGKTPSMAAGICDQFKNRNVGKRYLAVIHGRLEDGGELRQQVEHRNNKTVIIDAPDSSDSLIALLTWRAICSIDHPKAGPETLISISLSTGRRHQIRGQFAHIGFPIVGDVLYGSKSRFAERCIALHAFSLDMTHPNDNSNIYARCPPPLWWQEKFPLELYEAAIETAKKRSTQSRHNSSKSDSEVII